MASVKQLRLGHYLWHCHMSIWMTMIYESHITTFHFFPSCVNACCRERKMHVVVNHIYPICQSRCSRTITQSMYAPHSIEDRTFSPAFFTSARGASCDTIFPSYERPLLISPHPHTVVAALIF